MNEQEQLDRLDAQIHSAQDELHQLDQQQKIMDREAALLRRRQRNHRLITRGGMLESYLRCPGQLSDAQVMRLLRLAFEQPAVRQLLESLLSDESSRDLASTPAPSALPQGRNYT